MSYANTVDEKSTGFYSFSASAYSDAPFSLDTTYVIAPSSTEAAYGLLTAASGVADQDIYAMGTLYAGTYSISASRWTWFFGTGYSNYITPIVYIYNSLAVIVASGLYGTANFTITTPGTYYIDVKGSSSSSSQYQLIYTKEAPVNYALTSDVSIYGTTKPGNTVGVTGTYTDANGTTSSSLNYYWYVAGAVVSYSSTYAISSSDAGKTLVAVISLYDDAGYFETFGAAATIGAINDTPIATSATITTNEDTSKSGTLTGTDADSNTLTFSKVTDPSHGTVSIDATTGAYTYTPADNYSGSDSFTFTVNDGSVDSGVATLTVTVTNDNDSPTGTVTITGTATQGQTLTAANSLADLDGLGTISYQWSAAGTAITGATSSTYVLTESEVGKAITVAASYTDLHSSAESVSSSATAAVVNTNDSPTGSKTVDLLAYNWKAHTLLTDVSLSFVGTDHSGITGASGSVSFATVTDTNVTLSATRTTPAEEAGATSAAVNLQDAIAILKMIVGLPVNGSNQALSPYQALAADYDGNGVVQLSDAIAVLKHVVGLTAPDPTWYFVNELDASVPEKTNLNPGLPQATATADLSSSSPVHVGLVGYLSGDVDGSYTGATGASDLDIVLPNYFSTLVGAHAELSLAQFGM